MISRLGKYEIQAEIGRGGFGQVLRATAGKRVVAIKVLTGKQDAKAFDKFKTEYTTAANLHHKNIVRVYEFGQENETQFVVMEYLDGENLQQIIRKNSPLSLYQKLRIMDQLADGLHCAHRAGVTHRDVKPSNVMVLKDGTVRIMDFAIARLLRDCRSEDPAEFLELVVYCAPERIASKPVKADPLSDIWSYGVVLYEFLTGKNPFEGKSIHNAVYRIVTQDPAPLPEEQYPAELQAIVSKLLSKQQELRYQTLEEVQLDLQSIVKGLEKDEADRLVFEAQILASRQNWGEAYELLREARTLDPQNSSARILYGEARTEWQKEFARRRFDDLLQRSAEAAEQRKIAYAIELLNDARILDTLDEQVPARLQELRVLKLRLDEAAALLIEAGQEFREQRLTPAFEHASKAVSLDPDNQDAQRLRGDIWWAIRARDAETALQSEIRRARDLMAAGDLDGSMDLLGSLDAKHPGRADVGELMGKLAALINERKVPAGQYTIGPYQIHGKLGHGGMGLVYKGFDPKIQRSVAIKVIHMPGSAEPAQIAEANLRFEREAIAAGRLSHPNIATIYFTGEHQGDKFIAMELVEGQSLDELIRKGRMDLATVLRILAQVADGLDYAHSRGVYHRDIKPPNILVGDDGVTKIADFGIAKIATGAAGGITSETVTKTGMAIGSLPYMAPEQISDSRNIDARADQYSLAVMAYQIFCGRRPFVADTDELMRKIAMEDAPLAHVINPNVPRACSLVLAKALAKRAADRYKNCRTFVESLSAACR